MSDVEIKTRGLVVPLSAGQAYFNFFWLRDNCPSSFDTETQERTFDIGTLTEEPTVVGARVENDRLVVEWAEEPHVSQYNLSWLEAHAIARPRDDTAAVTRKLWYRNHYSCLQRFTFDDVLQKDLHRADWAHALLKEGVSIIDAMPDTDQALNDLANTLGSIRASVAGMYFDVRVHIDPVNLSFTSAPLEMHTDTPAEELPPGIQFLHCRRNSVDGGDSLFLDGAAVAQDFRQDHPDDFALLAETDIPFFYSHDSFDWRARQRVIELDREGDVSGVTVSRHMADVIDLPQVDLDRYYPALWRFCRQLQNDRYLMKFRLSAGECIVFDNHRIVHGREGYSASSGERHLRGCYIDRGELRSTYRILHKALSDEQAFERLHHIQ